MLTTIAARAGRAADDAGCPDAGRLGSRGRFDRLLAPKAPPPGGGEGEEEELQGHTFFGIGDGAIATASGDAHFSILATQVTGAGATDPVVIGQIQWATTAPDGAALTITSLAVGDCGWIDGLDGGR